MYDISFTVDKNDENPENKKYGEDLNFYFENPNLQIVKPPEERKYKYIDSDEEEEEERVPNLFRFEIYDYDTEKTICSYEIRFSSQRKRLESRQVKCEFDYQDNIMYFKRNNRPTYEVIGFELHELKYFLRNIKEDEDCSFYLFSMEGYYMLSVDYSKGSNILKFSNMLCDGLGCKSRTVYIELNIQNPLIRCNIIAQFDELYKDLQALLKFQPKKK